MLSVLAGGLLLWLGLLAGLQAATPAPTAPRRWHLRPCVGRAPPPLPALTAESASNFAWRDLRSRCVAKAYPTSPATHDALGGAAAAPGASRVRRRATTALGGRGRDAGATIQRLRSLSIAEGRRCRSSTDAKTYSVEAVYDSRVTAGHRAVAVGGPHLRNWRSGAAALDVRGRVALGSGSDRRSMSWSCAVSAGPKQTYAIRAVSTAGVRGSSTRHRARATRVLEHPS